MSLSRLERLPQRYKRRVAVYHARSMPKKEAERAEQFQQPLTLRIRLQNTQLLYVIAGQRPRDTQNLARLYSIILSCVVLAYF